MRLKRWLALVILAALMLSQAQATDAPWFQPYDKAAGYHYVAFGSYPYEKDGTVRPILWRMLRQEGGRVYLLSEYLIEVSRLHSVAFGYPGWDKADLNLWLNGEFIDKAFTPAEAAALTEEPELGRVSLPSDADIKDKALGFDSDQSRRAIGSPWADSRGLFFYRHKGHSPYWTRTPSTKDFAHRTTKLEGNIGYLGVTADDLGVRPVIWLDQSLVQVQSGSGAMMDPFVLAPTGAAPAPAAPAVEAPPWLRLNRSRKRRKKFRRQRTCLKPSLKKRTRLSSNLRHSSPRPKSRRQRPSRPPASPAGPRPATCAPGISRADAGRLPPEGEKPYIHIDEAAGKWRFADQTLRILIDKEHKEALNSNVLTAEIYLKEGAPGFHMVHHDPENRSVNRDAFKEKPALIAKNNKLVFTMNGDYYLYRVYMAKTKPSYPIGVIIRNGDVLFDKAPKPTRTAYPPLDNLALLPNGDMKVYKANEVTAKEFLAMGARDVLAFGPYLIKDGQINSFSQTYGNTNQPRSGMGMVAPGHYFAAVVEGRIKGSKGTTVSALCQHLADLGCTTAYNLDGGDTAAMTFMGTQLNQLYKVNGKEKDRIQNEVMGIGYYADMK